MALLTKNSFNKLCRMMIFVMLTVPVGKYIAAEKLLDKLQKSKNVTEKTRLKKVETSQRLIKKVFATNLLLHSRKYMSDFSPQKNSKKRFRKIVNIAYGSMATAMIVVAVSVAYLKQRDTQALGDRENQVNVLTEERNQLQSQNSSVEQHRNQLQQQNNQLQQERHQLQTENNSIEQHRNELQEERNQLQTQNSSIERERNQLQEQNNQLQERNNYLENQNKSLQEQSDIYPFGPNIESKTESLGHREKVRNKHAATGCSNDDHQFERLMHNSEKANKAPDTGEYLNEHHFKKFFCGICGKNIPVSYLVDGLAFYRCLYHDQHSAQKGFYVCRSCATGKEAHPCSRCGDDYVKIFPYEKEHLCLICVGFDKQLAALTEILTAAGLSLPRLQTKPPGDNEKVLNLLAVEFQNKKIEDPYIIEEITYKIKQYQKRYTYLNPEKTLAVTKDSLKGELEDKNSGEPVQHYQRIMALLNRDGQEVEVVTNAYCYIYYWEGSIDAGNRTAHCRQWLNVSWIRSLRQSENEAYLVFKNRRNPLVNRVALLTF